jgi:cytochrome c553
MIRLQYAVTTIAVVTLIALTVRGDEAAESNESPLAPGIEWAYGYRVGPPIPTNLPRPPQRPKLTPQTLMRVPGSTVACPNDVFDRPNDGSRDGDIDICDWYPEDRGFAPIPFIVSRGRKLFNPDGAWTGKEGVRACGQCHLSTGAGRNENSQPGGHSRAYILQQIEDFRHGLRNSADPEKDNTPRMTSYAKLMTREEINQAADFFSSQPYPPLGLDRYVKVVETDTVPVARATGGMFNVVYGAGEEPIGDRIVEVPQDAVRTGLRDGKSGFIAYVPPGSVARGEALVAKARCELCHGPELNGTAVAPTIAGRTASYLARELYDFQVGSRRGKLSVLMRPVVADFTTEDIRNIVAYVASIAPKKRKEH